MYSCALDESGKAGSVVGIEAPFWVSSSAMGKAAILAAAAAAAAAPVRGEDE